MWLGRQDQQVEARQKFVGGVQMEETVVQLLLFADKLDACGRKR